MAKPIKETPVLKGNDAKVFLDKMTQNSIKRSTPQEKFKIQENFNRLNAIVKF
jgi:hypothetical protein